MMLKSRGQAYFRTQKFSENFYWLMQGPILLFIKISTSAVVKACVII